MGQLRQVSLASVAIIGDIHGSAEALSELLGAVGELPIIVVGDVADRGRDSRGVLEQLVACRAIGVRGNHDDWLLAWARGEGFDPIALSEIMGGRATLESYGVTGLTTPAIEAERFKVPADHVAFLEDLADALDLSVAGTKYWVMHGGVPQLPGLSLASEDIIPRLVQHSPADLRCTRHPLEGAPDYGRPVIVGHAPLAEPVINDRVMAIDTGAGTREHGRLTALVLPERRLLSVPAPGHPTHRESSGGWGLD
jgi:predicted phosphodiesterase